MAHPILNHLLAGGLFALQKGGEAWLARKAQGKGQTPGAQALSLSRDGLPAADVTQSLLEAFLDTPASSDEAVAAQIAKTVSQANAPTLTPDERADQTSQVAPIFAAHAEGTATALSKDPAVSAVTGVTAEVLNGADQKSAELRRIDSTLDDAQRMVSDGKRVLEAWQSVTRTTVASAVFTDLADTTLPDAERRQLLADAVDIIAAEEEALVARMNTQKNNAAALGGLQQQLADEKQSLLVLQTLRDLRQGIDPPPAVLEQVAEYYAAHQDDFDSGAAATGPAAPAAGATGKAPTRKGTTGQTAKPAKNGKKKTPKPVAGSSAPANQRGSVRG